MKRSFLLALLAPVVLAGSLNAATDYLLEIDGIKGESSDAQRPGTIEIESFSWATTNTPAAGSGGGAGKVSFSDMHFTVKLSKATPQLLVASATGSHIPTAKLYGRKSGGGQEYYVITLENVLVSSLRQAGSGATSAPAGTNSPPPSSSPPPTDSFSLNFAKVTLAHTGTNGTVTTGTAERTPTP